MHPLLLHQIADERVIGRRRSFHAQDRTVRRPRHGERRGTTRLRVGAGGLLIALGHHLAGPRAGQVGLGHPSPSS